MSSCFIMFGHRIVGVTSAYSIFMLDQSVSESALGAPNVKASTYTFQSVYYIRGITVGEAPDMVGSLAKDIFKMTCFHNVITMVAVATPKVTSWALEPGQRVRRRGR